MSFIHIFSTIYFYDFFEEWKCSFYSGIVIIFPSADSLTSFNAGMQLAVLQFISIDFQAPQLLAKSSYQ